MDASVASAIEYFPHRKLEIEELALRTPEFRSLCWDLSEAEGALRYWKQVSEPNEERRSEYEALVGELVAEIKLMLDQPAI